MQEERLNSKNKGESKGERWLSRVQNRSVVVRERTQEFAAIF